MLFELKTPTRDASLEILEMTTNPRGTMQCNTRRRHQVLSVRVVLYWNKLSQYLINASSVDISNVQGSSFCFLR